MTLCKGVSKLSAAVDQRVRATKTCAGVPAPTNLALHNAVLVD
jgi:hypothetical protein